jgi:hypothetical protein
VNGSGVQLGEPTFDVDNNLVYVGGTDGYVYTFSVPFP